MKMAETPFASIDWSGIERTEHPGEQGVAWWRTQQFGDIRLRLVEFSAGYRADHWCDKGHVIFCLSGALHTELKDGRAFVLRAGMSHQVGDNAEAHRCYTSIGAELFIVD